MTELPEKVRVWQKPASYKEKIHEGVMSSERVVSILKGRERLWEKS